MTLSVLERIAINQETTLGNVITEGKLVLSIRRARAKNEPAHLAGFIYQLPPADVADAAVSTDEFKQAFALVVYVIPAEDDETPVDTYNNDIAAAAVEALMSDYTRGGLALNTIIQPPLYFPSVAGDYAGITLLWEVHYRTKLDKPYLPAT